MVNTSFLTSLVMYYQRLSDEEILSGFREGDADIIREYFYGYCQVGYNIFDQRYQLREKENLDFMSLAHQYALSSTGSAMWCSMH